MFLGWTNGLYLSSAQADTDIHITIDVIKLTQQIWTFYKKNALVRTLDNRFSLLSVAIVSENRSPKENGEPCWLLHLTSFLSLHLMQSVLNNRSTYSTGQGT